MSAAKELSRGAHLLLMGDRAEPKPKGEDDEAKDRPGPNRRKLTGVDRFRKVEFSKFQGELIKRYRFDSWITT